MNSAGSFFRFTLGFLTFISVSLGITYAVGTIELAKSSDQQTAAAVQAVIETKK